MKDKNCDFSVSNIILRTDKRQEVNTHLRYMCNDKFIYLIGNTNQIKAHHLSKGSNVNKRGSNVLSSTFVNELSMILTWQRDKNNTGFNVEQCNSDETNVDQKVTDGSKVLKSLRCNNLSQLAFAHLNINSIRNKLEFLSEHVRCNVDVLMVSENKIDDSFMVLVHHIGLIVIQKVVESCYT